MRKRFNNFIKNYVLSNQKLSEDIMKSINDKAAKRQIVELNKATSTTWKRKPNSKG